MRDDDVEEAQYKDITKNLSFPYGPAPNRDDEVEEGEASLGAAGYETGPQFDRDDEVEEQRAAATKPTTFTQMGGWRRDDELSDDEVEEIGQVYIGGKPQFSDKFVDEQGLELETKEAPGELDNNDDEHEKLQHGSQYDNAMQEDKMHPLKKRFMEIGGGVIGIPAIGDAVRRK